MINEIFIIFLTLVAIYSVIKILKIDEKIRRILFKRAKLKGEAIILERRKMGEVK